MGSMRIYCLNALGVVTLRRIHTKNAQNGLV